MISRKNLFILLFFVLNWFPKISFEQLVKEMIDEDLKLAKNDTLNNS